MMKKFHILLVLVVTLISAGLAGATVLDFEDLYPGFETNTVLPAGYAGFNWSSNAWFTTSQDVPGSGYDYGTIGKVSLFTAYASDLSMDNGYFDFNGAYISSAWNSGQDVTVEGRRDGALLYSSTIITSYDQPYWFDFNFDDINSLWFRPGELGTDENLGGEGHHAVIDNITINENVPEPGTLLLLGSSLAGLAFARRKMK